MVEEIQEEKTQTENTIIQETKKKQEREVKQKKWSQVEDAVSAARKAFIGSFEPVEGEKTISFESAVNDLIAVLEKIKTGEIELGGLEEGKAELPTTGA